MSRYDRQQVGMMVTATDVYMALAARRQQDPAYIKAVLKSYIDVKFARGKTKQEVSMKLEVLETQLPQFVHQFHAVRSECGLPRSRIFPALRDSTAPLRRATTAQPRGSGGTTNNLSRVSTTAGTTTVRPTVPADEEEPPPPPYASQDPEPDSTRLLQERLAAEAGASAIPPMSLGGPSRPAASSGGQSSTVISSRVSSNSGSRPSNPTSPPSARRYSPPATSRRQSSLMERPPTPPIDAEDAEVREQSLLEEAKRASMASERERLELEQAVRLSLADAEANQLRLSQQDEAGPSRLPMPIVNEDEDEVLSSRRASSYHSLGQGGGRTNHQRATSDFGGSQSGGLADGMANLKIPGGWNGERNQSNTSRHSMEDLLLDIPDYSALTQEPLTPNKTGVQIRSNNPFLSPQEREQLDSALPPLPPSTPDPRPLNPPRQSSTSQQSPRSTRDSPGSGHTSFAPASGSSPPSLALPARSLPRPPSIAVLPSTNLPRDDGEPQYDPPPGPPPRKVTPVSQSYSSPPPLPPRQEVQISSAPHLPTPPPIMAQTIMQYGGEDPLEMLRHFDTVFLVDDSTSMTGQRWSQARGALMEVAEIAARYDENGVDIYFLNNKRVGKELRSSEEVEDLFRGLEPKGATPTGLRLEAILRDYMTKLERSVATPGAEEVKPMNLIVVTDGVFARPLTARLRQLAADPSLSRADLMNSAPTDDPESVLIAIAKRLDRGEFPLSQVGIQLLQIGDDSEAREALQELDDGLAENHGVRDMVDTVPFDGEEMSAGLIVKVLLGGINRRLDRRRTG